MSLSKILGFYSSTNRKTFIDGYNYSDVYMIPKKCVVESRSHCDTSLTLKNHAFSRTFILPVVASNMKTVVDENTCEYFASKNMFYIMHRFGIDIVQFARNMYNKGHFVSISIGINDSSKFVIQKLAEEKIPVEFITIDIAHCWYERAKNMVSFVRQYFENSYLIIGNVASAEAFSEVQSWPVDAIKVGIGSGKVCTTKNKTGFHVPMVTSILDCVKVAKKPIIADGGINEHGDIAKALALGAEMVMAGSLFAGYDQSAGYIVEINNKKYKEYYGSASEFNKGEHKNVEGKKILIPYKGSMDLLIKELKEDLQSAISYAGGTTLQDLKNHSLFVIL
ncbi:MAG: GMP reductase [Candidatus Dojkabacteria bacterium]|nr:GMP reductase [Candidatus Dojkabacteria bacterium]